MEAIKVFLEVALACGGAVWFLYGQLDSLEKKIVERLVEQWDDDRAFERDRIDRLQKDFFNLLNRYNARGKRINDNFDRFRTKCLENRADIENLYSSVFELENDLAEVCSSTGVRCTTRRIVDFEEWRRRNKRDFDTLNNLQIDDITNIQNN